MCACGSGEKSGETSCLAGGKDISRRENERFSICFRSLQYSTRTRSQEKRTLAFPFSGARPSEPEMASPEEAAPGAEPFDVRELQGRIDAVLEREHASWGVLVYSTGLGRDIAAHRPDTALVPASNVKLFTALASLLVSHVGPTRACHRRERPPRARRCAARAWGRRATPEATRAR